MKNTHRFRLQIADAKITRFELKLNQDYTKEETLNKRIGYLVLAIIAIAALLPTGCKPGELSPLSPPKPKELMKVRVSQATKASTSGFIVTAAEKKGFFREEGLDVEIIWTYDQIKGLIAGSIDISGSSPDWVATAVVQGAELIDVALMETRAPYFMFSRPEIKSMAELKGKVFGVFDIPSGDQAVAWVALQKRGVDVSWRKAGGTPARMAALIAGQIDATLIIVPAHIAAMKAGLNVLLEPSDMDYPWISYQVRRSWAEKNRDAVVGYLRAVDKSMKWLSDPANATEVKQLIMEEGKVDQEAADSTYDIEMKSGLLKLRPLLPVELDPMFKAIKQFGQVAQDYDWRRQVDNSYIEVALKK